MAKEKEREERETEEAGVGGDEYTGCSFGYLIRSKLNSPRTMFKVHSATMRCG